MRKIILIVESYEIDGKYQHIIKNRNGDLTNKKAIGYINYIKRFNEQMLAENKIKSLSARLQFNINN
jgi:hypothetical protein